LNDVGCSPPRSPRPYLLGTFQSLTLFLFLLILTFSFFIQLNASKSTSTTARMRGRRREDARSCEYISPAMTRGRRTQGRRALGVQLTGDEDVGSEDIGREDMRTCTPTSSTTAAAPFSGSMMAAPFSTTAAIPPSSMAASTVGAHHGLHARSLHLHCAASIDPSAPSSMAAQPPGARPRPGGVTHPAT
jgi:hypothetical protein